MKFKFRHLTYLIALAATVLMAGSHSAFETVISFVALASGMGIAPGFSLGACAELTAFRTAVESLDQRVLRSPRLGRANFWRNMIPKGDFVKNAGVTRSTFQVKSTEPADDNTLWYPVTLSAGQPNNACDTNYEDINVAMFERTYGPKKRRFRGPVICKENLTFQHNPEAFLNAYVDEMGKVIARIWEFTLRADYLGFGNIYVDGVKYAGPNAIATAPRAFQGLSQSSLDLMAAGQINVGAGSTTDGYTTFGAGGPIFPLELDMVDSANLLKANSTVRDDARYASEGMDGGGDLSLFKAIGASRVIGNYRHVPTPIPVRLNYTNGAYVAIGPFKDITAVGTDGEILTDAYKNASHGLAIQLSPEAFTAEVVTPSNWRFPNTQNYNGEWDFIIGGTIVCNPSVYDPQGEKGRHFAKIEYAARPDYPYLASALIYKRCPQNSASIFCS